MALDRQQPKEPNERPFSHGRKDIYPNTNSIAKGRDAKPLSETRRRAVAGAANAEMVNQLGEVIRLWVEDFEAEFTVAGTTAQSRKVRQFFPRNFVQPSVRLTCIAPTQLDYLRFSEFVRSSHIYALEGQEYKAQFNAGTVREFRNDRGLFIPTVLLRLRDKTPEGFKKSVRSKGGHRPWALEGYIRNMTAGAERFVYAPRFQFDFTIAVNRNPRGAEVAMWDDLRHRGSQIASWAEIFKARPGNEFVEQGSRRRRRRQRPVQPRSNPESVLDQPYVLPPDFGTDTTSG